MTTDSFFAVLGEGFDAVAGDRVHSDAGFAVAVRGPRSSLASDDEGALAFVGRVDNARELARVLGVGDEVATGSVKVGAQLTLRAWRRWGDAFLDRIVGSYSGVAIDAQRREMHVFRDITAGGTAYATLGKDAACAGSNLIEVASWRGHLVPSELFVASYLQGIWLDSVATPFEGLMAVVPGHIATVTQRRLAWRQEKIAKWRVRPIRHRTFDGYLEEFASYLDKAVGRRLTGSSKAAVALSGGLDSTNVLASATLCMPADAITAYAIPFRRPEGDERARQRAVAAHCRVPLRWVSVDGLGPLGKWSGQLFAGRPAPPLAGNWYFAEAICRRADADGVTVVCDGEDADSLLTGNRAYLADLLATARLRTWLREAQRIRDHDGGTLWQSLRYSLYKQIPNQALALIGRQPTAATPSALVARRLAGAVNLEERLRLMPVARVWNPGRRFARYLRLAGEDRHLGMLVPELSMAARECAVTTEHPFLDRDLMTFCMGLPWSAVCGELTPKRLLRELARQRLPAEIYAAFTKARLDEYYDAAVYGHEKELVLEGLDLARERPEWVDPHEVEKLRHELETRQQSFMPSRVAMLMLWADQLRAGRPMTGQRAQSK